MTTRAHLIRSSLFLLLFLGPAGAPLIGVLITSVCPADTSMIDPGMFYDHYCGVNRTIEGLFQWAMFFSMLGPGAVVGPFLGWMVGVAWWLAGLFCGWSAGRHAILAIRSFNGEGP